MAALFQPILSSNYLALKILEGLAGEGAGLMLEVALELDRRDGTRELAVPAIRLLALLLDPDVLSGTSLRFLLGLPSSHWLTWLAKRREHSDSKKESSVGLKLTTMSVFPSPDSAGCKRWVNFEFR